MCGLRESVVNLATYLATSLTTYLATYIGGDIGRECLKYDSSKFIVFLGRIVANYLLINNLCPLFKSYNQKKQDILNDQIHSNLHKNPPSNIHGCLPSNLFHYIDSETILSYL